MTRRGEHRPNRLAYDPRPPTRSAAGPKATTAQGWPQALVTTSILTLLLSAWPAQIRGEAPPVAPPITHHVPLQSFALSLEQSAAALPLPPNGTVRITGMLTYQPDGTVFDAGSTLASGQTQAQGLIDPVASGLALTGADANQHVYSYRVGATNTQCAQAGLSPPCLILRLPELAARRLLDVDEFREQLQGQLNVEISGPAAGAPVQVMPIAAPTFPRPSPGPPPPGTNWVRVAALTASGSGLALSVGLLFFGLRRRQRARNTPVSRVETAQRRLERQLAGDKGKERLRAVVGELAQEAQRQADRQSRLEKAIHQANPTQLQQRRDELRHQAEGLAQRGGEAAGQTEMEEAAQIVEQQLRRCEQWEMQRWRAGARLERIATRLEALHNELNAPAVNGQQQNDELLQLLQEELDLARAGEQEVDDMLDSSSESSSNGRA